MATRMTSTVERVWSLRVYRLRWGDLEHWLGGRGLLAALPLLNWILPSLQVSPSRACRLHDAMSPFSHTSTRLAVSDTTRSGPCYPAIVTAELSRNNSRPLTQTDKNGWRVVMPIVLRSRGTTCKCLCAVVMACCRVPHGYHAVQQVLCEICW